MEASTLQGFFFRVGHDCQPSLPPPLPPFPSKIRQLMQLSQISLQNIIRNMPTMIQTPYAATATHGRWSELLIDS